MTMMKEGSASHMMRGLNVIKRKRRVYSQLSMTIVVLRRRTRAVAIYCYKTVNASVCVKLDVCKIEGKVV